MKPQTTARLYHFFLCLCLSLAFFNLYRVNVRVSDHERVDNKITQSLCETVAKQKKEIEDQQSQITVMQGEFARYNRDIQKCHDELMILQGRFNNMQNLPVFKAAAGEPHPGPFPLEIARQDIRRLRKVSEEYGKLADKYTAEMKAAGYEP